MTREMTLADIRCARERAMREGDAGAAELTALALEGDADACVALADTLALRRMRPLRVRALRRGRATTRRSE